MVIGQKVNEIWDFVYEVVSWVEVINCLVDEVEVGGLQIWEVGNQMFVVMVVLQICFIMMIWQIEVGNCC